MALDTCGGGGYVVGGLACTGDVAGKRGRRSVTTSAIAGRRVSGIESRGRPGISRSGGAGQHAEVIRCLVAGLAGRHRRRYRRMPGGVERRVSGAGRTDVESARIEVGGAVATGSVAVEGADRNVIGRCRRDRS